MTDPQAIDLLKSGDEIGFNHLYSTYYSQVKGICGRFLRDKSEAEDVTQEVFLRLFCQVRHFKGESQFSTWLTSIANNVCRDVLRRKKSRVPPFTVLECPDSGQDPQTVAVNCIPSADLSALDRIVLSDAWGTISEEAREDFTASVLYGFSAARVCEIRGVIPTHGALVKVRKARRKTRSILKEALA